jgi:hypothetical protein
MKLMEEHNKNIQADPKSRKAFRDDEEPVNMCLTKWQIEKIEFMLGKGI